MFKAISKLVLLLTIGAAMPARAVKVADITRLFGQRPNVLVGMGLVTGLKGTGDGSNFEAANKMLATMLTRFADKTAEKELGNSANIAIVQITVVTPVDGWHSGDQINAHVQSIGAASSLKGGRLFPAPMEGPAKNGGIYAMSEGEIELEDPSTPTAGVIKGGCITESEFHMPYVRDGHFTLVIADPTASWITSSAIAQII